MKRADDSWLKWANKSESPTHTVECPDCRGGGRRKVGAVDDYPLYERCFRCHGSGEIGAVMVKGAQDDAEVLRVTFQIDGNDYMRLTREREETPMADAIRLARGTPGTLRRCPVCDGPYDVLKAGTGWTECPHCDTRLHFASSGEVTDQGEVLAASRGFDLSPMERRIARQLGVTFEEAQAAKKLYG